MSSILTAGAGMQSAPDVINRPRRSRACLAAGHRRDPICRRYQARRNRTCGSLACSRGESLGDWPLFRKSCTPLLRGEGRGWLHAGGTSRGTPGPRFVLAWEWGVNLDCSTTGNGRTLEPPQPDPAAATSNPQRTGRRLLRIGDMAENQKSPWRSFHRSPVFWLILVLLIISVADIFSAWLSATASH